MFPREFGISTHPEGIYPEANHYRGRRRKIPTHLEGGKIVLIPEQFLPIETYILNYASHVQGENPESPSFYGYSLSKKLSIIRSTKSGGIHKALRRLEEWGFLSSSTEIVQVSLPGCVAIRRNYTITDKGWERIQLESK